MAQQNDNQILELKKKVEEKRKVVGKVKRFTPITNCLLELDGIKYNLNVLNKNDLTFLLVKLNLYQMSYENLKMEHEFIISGFLLSDWIADVQLKISIMLQNEEQRQLNALESKLTELLSNEKKVELELSYIANLLK